ncbi:hypothetical protein B0H10DRAFT_2239795 [Mycena sp. CBHHK59/15]|nr:hypothetical protein B0H10DRAFT_2239795 [Mycena sp. CBHHK59/15]
MAQDIFAMGIVTPDNFYSTPKQSTTETSTRSASDVVTTSAVISRALADPVQVETEQASQHTKKSKGAKGNRNGPLAAPVTNTASSQTMLRGKKRSEWEKADQLLAQINKDFASLGRFLEVLFYNRISGVLDPRTNRHVQSVAAFLNGTNNVTMGTLINLLYNHPQSRAPSNALDYSLHFSPPDVASPRDIDYARPALSTWALQTVVPELRRQTPAWRKLRESVAEGIANGTMYWQIVLDNIQQYCRQRDHRLGRQDVLKVGTAATAILLEDCAPGAFNLQDHLDRVMKQERRQLTIDALYADIDWKYIHELTALLWVRILVHFIPQLAYLRQDVAALFNSDAMTKHRLPKGRITVMQPVGTNAEHSTETQGMMRAMLDFEGQMGLDEQAMEGLIFMPRGDGASIAAIWRIKKYLSAHPEHYKAFRNRVPPGPEIFHTRWTQLNAMSNNSGGGKAAVEPEESRLLSHITKHETIFEARVLDCWRIWFDAADIIEHFAKPMRNPPDIHGLLKAARILVRRYASQQAYAQALNQDFVDSANVEMKIPLGTPWVSPVESSRTEDDEGEGEPEDNEADPVILDEPDEEGEILSESEDGGQKKKKKRPSVHVEADDFMGDRVVANEALFLQDMGWWILVSDAVPTIWILSFCGSGNRNYTNYLLETYCLHRYEASKDFSNAMFNNWLINLRGHKYIECDWVQEDFNKWLEEMVEHKGGDFDDHFYRHTLAPNVMHFLRMKEKMETAFDLTPRGKTHGLPPPEKRLTKFIRDSTAYADITKDVLDGQEHDDWDEEQQRNEDSDSEDESETESMAGDNSGDPGIRGIDYSDDESESDGETLDFGAEEPNEDSEGDEEDEVRSEMEEEEMDKYVPVIEEPAPEGAK